MPWNLAKCLWGTPAPFTDADAATAVANADFTAAVFVQTSNTGVTKKAFTYVVTGGCRICVAGDVHRANAGAPWNIAGNSFIPGWLGDAGNGWQMATPAAAVAVIGPMADGGAFPGNDRYPHPAP